MYASLHAGQDHGVSSRSAPCSPSAEEPEPALISSCQLEPEDQPRKDIPTKVASTENMYFTYSGKRRTCWFFFFFLHAEAKGTHLYRWEKKSSLTSSNPTEQQSSKKQSLWILKRPFLTTNKLSHHTYSNLKLTITKVVEYALVQSFFF